MAEPKLAIPRMKVLGARMIRGMSFTIGEGVDPLDPGLEKNVIAKIRKYVEVCVDSDIVFTHENRMNRGGMSSGHSPKLIEKVDSKYPSLVFDTGNPVSAPDYRGKGPYKKTGRL